MSGDVAAFNPLAYPAGLLNLEWMTNTSGWIGHAPVGMTLVQMLQPRVLVELGTYKGDSYFAFCQAVAQLGGQTRCFAIDSWRGDEHAGTIEDGDELLRLLRSYHDPRYSSFSTLVQSDFDAAAPRFADGSIDLLHIDGCHTYEAVQNDFETWRPKLSDRAVVLFHDTQVRDFGFGVYKFWSEISPGRPHFEFHHNAGLGVLGVGSQLPAEFMSFIAAANAAPDLIRQHFLCLGQRLEFFMKLSKLERAAKA